MQSKSEGQSRQDQILLLAADGLTDKEIAARLGLSPETVGTYWRRILAKHNAASRTEVVAKVIEFRAQSEARKLEDLAESFREVTDHLFMQLAESQNNTQVEADPIWELVIDSVSDVFAVVDSEAFVTHRSKGTPALSLAVGEPIEWSVHTDDRDTLRQAIGDALDQGRPASIGLRFSYLDGSYVRHRVRMHPLSNQSSLSVQIAME